MLIKTQLTAGERCAALADYINKLPNVRFNMSKITCCIYGHGCRLWTEYGDDEVLGVYDQFAAMLGVGVPEARSIYHSYQLNKDNAVVLLRELADQHTQLQQWVAEDEAEELALQLQPA